MNESFDWATFNRIGCAIANLPVVLVDGSMRVPLESVLSILESYSVPGCGHKIDVAARRVSLMYTRPVALAQQEETHEKD